MARYRLEFIANRLDDRDKKLKIFTMEVEASNASSALNSLYHTYEHVDLASMECKEIIKHKENKNV